jgi:methylated-DNA-[protein]-cysteine S-methyltransferase
MTVVHDLFRSPVGELLLTADDDGLTGIRFETSSGDRRATRDGRRDGVGHGAPTRILAAARDQLEGYFAGARRTFDLPLAARGTPFERRVWEALRDIPFGRTVSYGELARTLGEPGSARAVGAANGRNPVPIVVPCHRVIGANGSLVGFGGGLERKRWLLEHEGALDGSATLRLPL